MSDFLLMLDLSKCDGQLNAFRTQLPDSLFSEPLAIFTETAHPLVHFLPVNRMKHLKVDVDLPDRAL